MNSGKRELNPPDRSAWRRLAARLVKALSDLLEASEPKRKRPRNLYIRGMTSQALVTRRCSER